MAENEHLNAAQMAQVTKHIAEFVKDVKLRQWCIEKSIESLGTPVPIGSEDGKIYLNFSIQLADQIYRFLMRAPNE